MSPETVTSNVTVRIAEQVTATVVTLLVAIPEPLATTQLYAGGGGAPDGGVVYTW